jgi:hypothetical protein
MAPSTKVTCPQVDKKQQKISAFGRITKITPAATSQKAYLAKVAPAVRPTEPTNSCLGATNKRRYEASDEEKSYSSEDQVNVRVLKKVRSLLFSPLLLQLLTFSSGESSHHPRTHSRWSPLTPARLQSLLSRHAPTRFLLVYQNTHPTNPSQLHTYL